MIEPLWKPSPERVAQTRLTQYMRMAETQFDRSFATYDDLYQWSVEHVDEFWKSIWDLSGILHSKPYTTVLSGSEMFGSKWFRGARLNFAENLLRYRDDHPAIVVQSENQPVRKLSYRELYDEVTACAQGLRLLGVKSGDRVAGYITNIPEAIIAMLATTSIGAIWSSGSPDFGFKGAFDRFGQIGPRVLITVDSYRYNGQVYSPLDKVSQLVEHIPEIEQVVIVQNGYSDAHVDIPNTMTWENLTADRDAELQFEQLPFDHPVYIMYSSGTTGAPKCIVHGAGGTLLQHYKEHVLHTDLRRDDVLTYFTTCGWMMWNWLVSALQVGATVYLYDGSPSYPNLHSLWSAVEKEKITVLGTSPKFLSTCQNAGIQPGTEHDLSTLRAILSTGAPLSEDNFKWVYQHVKDDLQLSSISGGTDIISCFMLGNPNLPVFPGEIQSRGLGMKVETYDGNGKPVLGQVGELVCTAPFVSMPVRFWNDPDQKKYRNAYFETYSGVWRHGDYIKITQRGGVIVYGRSDATLNPGGVRIGTAEIYGPVESLEEIDDSLVIEQKTGDTGRIVLFVVLAEGYELTGELRDKIRSAIRTQQTPRHVPSVILPITDIPRTINGKKVELAVTQVVHGQDVPNREALINPEALDQFVDIPALQRQ